MPVRIALHASSLPGEVQTFGPSLGRPTEILQGRFARIGATQDVYARAERGQRNMATSEAEPHARRSEAQPR